MDNAARWRSGLRVSNTAFLGWGRNLRALVLKFVGAVIAAAVFAGVLSWLSATTSADTQRWYVRCVWLRCPPTVGKLTNAGLVVPTCLVANHFCSENLHRVMLISRHVSASPATHGDGRHCQPAPPCSHIEGAAQDDLYRINIVTLYSSK